MKSKQNIKNYDFKLTTFQRYSYERLSLWILFVNMKLEINLDWNYSNMKVGKKEKEILRAVAKGVLTTLTIFDHKLKGTDFYKDFMYDRRKRDLFNRSIKRLEEKGLVNLGGEKIKLSKEGLEILRRDEAWDINIRKSAWDGVWRIVGYDIPEDFKKERDYLAKKLKELGFYRVQKSMWAYPYDCKEEIAMFAQSLHVAPFVIYLTTDKLPNQTKVKNHFGLS